MPAKIDTTTRTITDAQGYEFHYSPERFANVDSFDFTERDYASRSYNGGEPKAWIIHNTGTVLAIVFAEYYAFSDQDALDEAVNAWKLDSLLVKPEDLPDYKIGEDSEGFPEYEGIINLGNASEPFDSQNLSYFSVPARLFATDETVARALEENTREE